MIFDLFSLGGSSYSSAVLLALGLLLGQDEAVKALFEKHCLECHSAKKVKGGLRMDSMEALLAGGDTGPSIVAGHPERSLLVKAIHGRDPDTVTPMPYKKTLLPAADRQLIEQWIAAAKWTGSNAAKAVDFSPELKRRRALTPGFHPLRPDPRASIDDYIHQKLKDVGLAPAPPADLDTLLRRLSFDLTGLPPGPGELPRDYERAVDVLLASPRFGETWARHWMDLVRYAESRGHEFDYAIPNAWRYRDYLIRAFNDDVPWSRLVRDHLAGDLGDAPVATGWWYFGEWIHSPVDIRGDEMDRVSNQIEVFAKGFLGLTVNCARCHDHKFDAISQKDFYALAGYLKSSAYRQVRLTLAEDRKIAAELDALRPPPIAVEVAPLDALYEFSGPLMQDGVAFRAARAGEANLDYYLPRAAAVYDPAWPKQTVRTPQLTLSTDTLWYLVRGAGSAFAEVDGHRMLEGPLHKATRISWKDTGLRWHAHRLKDYVGPTHHVRVEFTPASDDFAVFAVAASEQPLPKMPDAKPPPPEERRASIVARIQKDAPTAPAILDGPRSPEQLLTRGNPRTPAGDVPVRFLDALGAEEVDRLQLAEKVVASPLAARVAVNRVWHHLFGRGIVPSVDDFGQMGLPASHPELLDRLAADFQADPSYKRLIRRIVLSDAYRRGPGTPSEKDPTNALLSYRPARRLNAEALRDAMLFVSGRLDLTMYGPSVPVRLDGFQDGRGKPQNGPLDGEGRRSVYLAVRRNFLDTMLLAFDFPQPFGPMGRRNVSNVPAQALVLRNHPFVHQQAEIWAKRDAAIPDLFRAAFHRAPSASELAAAEDFLKTATKTDLAHALFQAKEFIFIR